MHHLHTYSLFVGAQVEHRCASTAAAKAPLICKHDTPRASKPAFSLTHPGSVCITGFLLSLAPTHTMDAVTTTSRKRAAPVTKKADALPSRVAKRAKGAVTEEEEVRVSARIQAQVTVSLRPAAPMQQPCTLKVHEVQ